MSPRFASIDALRGFAALWVFSYHLWNVFCPGCSAQTEPIPIDEKTPVAAAATFPVFAYGYAGVGLFFVLSGFCIHLPQARKFHAKGSDALDGREFAKRRFWRLYPAFLASLFLSSLAIGAMNVSWANPPCEQDSYDADGQLRPAGWTKEYVLQAFGLSWILPNAIFTLPLTPAAHKLNPVAWTLLFELQFYLLYPLLLKLVRKVGFVEVGAVLLMVEVNFALVPTPQFLEPLKPHFEWFFPRRYFDWFLGMWLAERLMSGNPLPARWGKRMLCVGIVGGPLASAFAWSWSLHELFFVVGSAGLVAWVVANPSATPNRLTRLFAPAGEWSYSLYLIHMPLMRMAFSLPPHLPESWNADLVFALTGAACAVGVPLFARVWYRLFEKPYLPTNAVKGEGHATTTAMQPAVAPSR